MRILKLLISSVFCFAFLAAGYAGDNSHLVAKARTTKLGIKSSSAMVFDQSTGTSIYGKNASVVTPIASITKLMTAMVILDSGLSLLAFHIFHMLLSFRLCPSHTRHQA